MLRMSDCFSEGGILSLRVPGFRYREAQEKMAEAVFSAISEGSHAVIEAATGTGKSYAYIVPLLLRAEEGERAVIATSTIPLMNQLLSKDIPQMAKALGVSADVRALYGRGNYVCNLKWDYLFLRSKDDDDVRAFSAWLDYQGTGLKEDLKNPRLLRIFQEVQADSKSCVGSGCPFFQSCFCYKARRNAQSADIIVTNHHVVLSDIMIRREKGAEEGDTVILPPYSTLVLDEAHNLPDGTTDLFTAVFSPAEIERSLKALTSGSRGVALLDALRPLMKTKDHYASILSAISEMKDLISDYSIRINELASQLRHGNDRVHFVDSFYEENRYQLRQFEPFAARLSELASLLHGAFVPPEDPSEEIWIALKRVSMEADTLLKEADLLSSWIDYTPPSQLIPYAEKEGSSYALCFAPLDTGDILADNLLDSGPSVIFSSATLSVDGKFDYFASQAGLDRCETGHTELLLPTAFDISRNLLFLAPEDLPKYSFQNGAWEDAMAKPIADAINAANGGALVLFTSKFSMDRVYKGVKELTSHRILKQDGTSRSVLFDRFRREKDSSLFALSSFWEGIDAPGDTLRLLIIPKLPYPVPTDPIVEARAEALEKKGSSAFVSQDIPICTLRLKQGIGRLIRSESDKGVVLVLDSRLVTYPLNKRILRSLPQKSGVSKICQIEGAISAFLGDHSTTARISE